MKRTADEDSQSELLKHQGDDINATATKQGRDYSSIIDKDAMAKKKKIKWGIIGAIILIIVILAIVLPLTLKKSGGGSPDAPPVRPHYNPYKLDVASISSKQSSYSVTIQAPAEYNQDLHFTALNSVIPTLKDGTKKLGIDSKGIPKGDNNKFIQNVNYQFDMLSWRVAHMVVTDKDAPRYSIPEMAIPKPKVDNTMRLDMLGFEFQDSGDKPFSFKIKDTVDKDNVFLSTEDQSLVVMDKFIQMDFQLPSQKLYGFGERVHNFQLEEGTWTMWAIGLDSPKDDGTGRKGTYGVHPFILVQTAKKGDYIGLFFRNSNAQSPVLVYTDDGKSILSYITLGGQIEVYFFVHGTAKDIITQYQSMFGKPNLPPFWSLGWQQASWKYLNQSMVEEVIDKYYQNNMMLETVYLDIPYMDKYSDFTVDTKAFPDLMGLSERLHKAGQRLVLIIDAAISAEDIQGTYYQQGNKDDVFIKSALYTSEKYNNNLISKVWPETAVFIDWFNPKCVNVWQKGLSDLYSKVNYDGIWIDMNEPTTFIHGEKKPEDAKPIEPTKTKKILKDDGENYSWYYEFKEQKDESTFNLPFIPGYVPSDDGHPQPFNGNFDYMTLSLNSTLPSIKEKEYNVHSLYGHMMANRTHLYLTSDQSPKPDDRPFILTRSSFASTGKYASHWLGDNWRDWDYMRLSIAGIMIMNMFGIPQAGADVCGFFGEKKDDEMCARWIQLSTFYPLARAHQNLTFNDGPSERSEPYLLEGDFKEWAKVSIRDRYHYLRHMYTCLYEVSQNGGTCIDPLFYYYPDDDNVYDDIEHTFMVGGAIKVSPVLSKLEEGQKTFQAYFPKGNWVSLQNYAAIIESKGEMKDLPTDQSTVHAHLRPGSLIGYQNLVNSQGQQIQTTGELITQPISIIINRDDNGYAYGSLFLDKGISRGEISGKGYEYYQISHQAKSIQFQLTEGARGNQEAYVDQLIITNAKDLQYVSFACYMDAQNQFHDLTPKYDEVKNIAYFTSSSQLKFSDILNVYYGSAKSNDVNLCSPTTFQYRVAKGVDFPLLNVSSIAVQLEHVAGTLPNIDLKMRVIDNDIVNVKWTWALDKDGKPPAGYRAQAEVPNDIINTDKPDAKTKLSSFVTVQQNPFQITFKYRSDSSPSNVLTIEGMLYDSYMNQINVKANTQTGADFQGIFGLGERANKDFFLKDGVYSMWSRDQPTPDETGKLPGNNMYGTHPFFMYKHKQSAWVGVLYKLAHAQDWWVKNDQKQGTVGIQTIATGGVADIYVMQSQFPDDVVNKYFMLIGRPVLVPQWSLGWNQCRWGYETLDALKEVAANYDKYNLPLDVQWSDIDWLNKYRTFEYDQDRFKDLPDYVKTLNDNGRQYVPILDAGIAYRPGGDYKAFNDAFEKDLFTKVGDKPFIGQVWPNDAVYPDYTNPDTVKWFQDNLQTLYEQVPFGGLWEDMNEASNFCKGACYREQVSATPVKQQLRYTPTGRDLEIKSMSLDTTHFNGLLQLDTHNYYGTQMVKATHEWFVKQNKRTFIIERSSFAGMGKFSSRWLGDNFSEDKFMGYSVSGIMQMNIFGITLAGSDICGFIGDTNPELCARWHHVGAYYPFSRNHNNWGQISQEPWAWGDLEYEPGMKYIDIFRSAIKMKYQLIRYYYTNLFMVSKYTQGTFFKPMFFEFPDDNNAYLDITYNVMVGNALKVSFNSEHQSQNETEFYFPAGIWCDIIRTNVPCFESKGQSYKMSTKVYETYLHLRQGYIVPFQTLGDQNIKTSKDLQQMPIELHILGESADDTQGPNWDAIGTYVNDDGIAYDIDGNFNGYNLIARAKKDSITVRILPTFVATNFMDGKGCSAVNKNDYLSVLYIYNAKGFQVNNTYKVTGTQYKSTTPLDLGTAAYDDKTDRLVLSFKQGSELCMTQIQSIEFAKQ